MVLGELGERDETLQCPCSANFRCWDMMSLGTSRYQNGLVGPKT